MHMCIQPLRAQPAVFSRRLRRHASQLHCSGYGRRTEQAIFMSHMPTPG
jgi:hypothetical protein